MVTTGVSYVGTPSLGDSSMHPVLVATDGLARGGFAKWRSKVTYHTQWTVAGRPSRRGTCVGHYLQRA